MTLKTLACSKAGTIGILGFSTKTRCFLTPKSGFGFSCCTLVVVGTVESNDQTSCSLLMWPSERTLLICVQSPIQAYITHHSNLTIMLSDIDDDSGHNSLTSCSQQQEQLVVEDEEDCASITIPHAISKNNTVEDVAIPLLDAANPPRSGNEESLKRPFAAGGGRIASNVWGWFTNETEPQKMECVTCQQCQQKVNHHRKSEAAKTHMNGCARVPDSTLS